MKIKQTKSLFLEYPGFAPFGIFEELKENSYILAKHNGPLYGRVSVAGAKNMVTKVIASSLTGEVGWVKIKNIPFIGELAITLALCKRLGVKYQVNPDKSLDLRIDGFDNPDVKFDSYLGNRTSILFAGPVLNKLRIANISKPRGCKIGKRKVDFHLAGLKAFGVRIEDRGDYYTLRLTNKKFQPAEINLPFPSVGATENLIIIASLAEGTSKIANAAVEPEIIEMVKILQRSGVFIKLDAKRTFIINGGPHKIIDTIEVIPDRIEAFSWAIVALSTKGDILVQGASQEHLLSALGLLNDMGAGIEVKNEGIRFYYKGELKPTRVATEVYPGFATDFQQPLAILMSQTKGESGIHETIFESRFRYLERLKEVAHNPKKINIVTRCPEDEACRFKNQGYSHLALLEGPIKFGKGEITIDDLRAGFALLNAGLLSRGLKIFGLKLLYRGYEDPVGKLKSVGADVELVI